MTDHSEFLTTPCIPHSHRLLRTEKESLQGELERAVVDRKQLQSAKEQLLKEIVGAG